MSIGLRLLIAFRLFDFPRMVICFVISVSVVTSLVFFSAMLLAIGPSGEFLGILGKHGRHPAASLGALHSAVRVIKPKVPDTVCVSLIETNE